MTTRGEVEYLIAGLEQELADGLARLERADAASDHAAWYRHWFNRYIGQLRGELDSETPDIHEIATAAMQAAWLARIWPVLQTSRLQDRAPNLTDHNDQKQKDAARKRSQCIAIASMMTDPTAGKVLVRYRTDHPDERPPSTRQIRRYLNSK